VNCPFNIEPEKNQYFSVLCFVVVVVSYCFYASYLPLLSLMKCMYTNKGQRVFA